MVDEKKRRGRVGIINGFLEKVILGCFDEERLCGKGRCRCYRLMKNMGKGEKVGDCGVWERIVKFGLRI